MLGFGCGPTPSGCPSLGVVQPPSGCPVLGVVQPPSGCPVLGVVQPPGDARSWVWSNLLGCPSLGVVGPPRRCVQAPSGNRRGPATTEAAAMGRSERSERDSLPPSGGAPSRLLGHRWPSPASRRAALSTLPPTI